MTESEVQQDDQLRSYAANCRTSRGAESYATKYDRECHKRVSSHSERRVIRRLLRRTGLRDGAVLDVPCGAGRLTPLLEPVASRLVSADYSQSMVGVLRRVHGHVGLVSDAFHLPFPDCTFDLVFSARLSHHIADADRRARYLAEIMRVSRTWTIATVFDSDSLKNRLRELRRRVMDKRPKHTLSREQVAAIAARAGFEIAAGIPLSRLASGHVYYLFKRV
jgi:ubiquinone/menaquinone biosynthesis C-methylase UbiE